MKGLFTVHKKCDANDETSIQNETILIQIGSVTRAWMEEQCANRQHVLRKPGCASSLSPPHHAFLLESEY